MVKRSYVEYEKFKERFFETKRFNNLVRIIDANLPIGQESLIYKQREIKGLSADSFREVFETVLHNVPQHIARKIPKSDRAFIHSDFYVDYKGIRFNVLTGQGSSYYVKRAK